MTVKQFIKLGALLALLLVTIFGVQYYREVSEGKALLDAIELSKNVCRTAPIGVWQKASDFPKHSD